MKLFNNVVFVRYANEFFSCLVIIAICTKTVITLQDLNRSKNFNLNFPQIFSLTRKTDFLISLILNFNFIQFKNTGQLFQMASDQLRSDVSPYHSLLLSVDDNFKQWRPHLMQEIINAWSLLKSPSCAILKTQKHIQYFFFNKFIISNIQENQRKSLNLHLSFRNQVQPRKV